MKPMRPVWLAAATWLASCLVGPASPAFGAGARGVATATVVPAEAIGSPAVDEILEQFKPLIELTPPANGMPLRLPVFSGGGGAGAGGEGGGSVDTGFSADGPVSLALAGGSGPSYSVTRSADGDLQVDFN